MENMSNSTKLLLGGAVVAILGFILPFTVVTSEYTDASLGVSLLQYAQSDNSLYISMIGLIAILILCLSPSLYKNNSKTFVTYELIAWGGNLLFLLIFYINIIANLFKLSDSLSLGIGGFLTIAGNIMIPIGLYQIWSNVGGGYVPPVFDAGAASPPRYREQQVRNDHVPAPRSAQPYPVEHPRSPAPVAPGAHRHTSSAGAWLAARDGRSYQLLHGETSIGRSSDNDIRIDNARVSKHHAKIIERNSHFTIVDLGSTNGTWLNGKLVRDPKLLHTNDEIRFGDSYKTSFVTSER